jgi:hypothetical protein
MGGFRYGPETRRLAGNFLDDLQMVDWDDLAKIENYAKAKPTFNYFVDQFDDILKSAEHYDTELSLAEEGPDWGLAHPDRMWSWGHDEIGGKVRNLDKFNQWMDDNHVRWKGKQF